MEIERIILFSYIPLGLACLFRPMLFLYLFLSLPALEYLPAAIGDFTTLKIMQLGSITIYVHDYLLLLLGLFFLKLTLRKDRRFISSLGTPISKVVILLFFWEIFISILSYAKGFELQNVLRNLSIESLLFIAILVPLIGSFDKEKEKLLQFSVIMGSIVILSAILKYNVFHEVELTSSTTQRTLAGNAVIILIFPLCYVMYYSRFWREHGWLALSFVFLVAVGIHFAGHRSGWIVFIFVTGLWFVLQERKMQLIWVPLWGVAFVAILMIFSVTAEYKSGTLIGDFFTRIADTVNFENATTQERISKWKYSLDTVTDNPLLGLGRFPLYTMHLNEENQSLAESFAELNRDPHNIIASKAIHEGLLGLGMLAIFFFVVFRQFEKVLLEDKRYYNFFRVFVMAFILFSLFNPIFTNQTGRIYLFITLGFLNAGIFKQAIKFYRLNQSSKKAQPYPSAGSIQ